MSVWLGGLFRLSDVIKLLDAWKAGVLWFFAGRVKRLLHPIIGRFREKFSQFNFLSTDKQFTLLFEVRGKRLHPGDGRHGSVISGMPDIGLAWGDDSQRRHW
jgi:hypothetical protein